MQLFLPKSTLTTNLWKKAARSLPLWKAWAKRKSFSPKTPTPREKRKITSVSSVSATNI